MTSVIPMQCSALLISSMLVQNSARPTVEPVLTVYGQNAPNR